LLPLLLICIPNPDGPPIDGCRSASSVAPYRPAVELTL